MDVVNGFLEVYTCNVSILTEGFTDIADIIEGVDVVSAGVVRTEAVLFITDFVVFF